MMRGEQHFSEIPSLAAGKRPTEAITRAKSYNRSGQPLGLLSPILLLEADPVLLLV